MIRLGSARFDLFFRIAILSGLSREYELDHGEDMLLRTTQF